MQQNFEKEHLQQDSTVNKLMQQEEVNGDRRLMDVPHRYYADEAITGRILESTINQVDQLGLHAATNLDPRQERETSARLS